VAVRHHHPRYPVETGGQETTLLVHGKVAGAATGGHPPDPQPVLGPRQQVRRHSLIGNAFEKSEEPGPLPGRLVVAAVDMSTNPAGHLARRIPCQEIRDIGKGKERIGRTEETAALEQQMRHVKGMP